MACSVFRWYTVQHGVQRCDSNSTRVEQNLCGFPTRQKKTNWILRLKSMKTASSNHRMYCVTLIPPFDNKSLIAHHFTSVKHFCILHQISEIYSSHNDSCLQTANSRSYFSQLLAWLSPIVNLQDSTLYPRTPSSAQLVNGLKPSNRELETIITPSFWPHPWLPIKARTYHLQILFNGVSLRALLWLGTPCYQLQSRTNLWSSDERGYTIQRTTQTLADGYSLLLVNPILTNPFRQATHLEFQSKFKLITLFL